MARSARSPLVGGGLVASPRPVDAPARTPRRQVALTVLTLAVVAFSAIAFVITQILKQEETPITGIEVESTVEPGCDCPRETARLSFVLRRAQPVSATIVTSDGRAVRELLDGALRGSGRETLFWDGTDDAGEVVRSGEYRLRLDLAAPERAIVIPDQIDVEGSGAAGRSGTP